MYHRTRNSLLYANLASSWTRSSKLYVVFIIDDDHSIIWVTRPSKKKETGEENIFANFKPGKMNEGKEKKYDYADFKRPAQEAFATIFVQ